MKGLGISHTVRAAVAVAVLACAWAPASGVAQELRAEPVAGGLNHPWAVAFLTQGRFLVTERDGRMRLIEANGKIHAPLAGVPRVAAGNRGYRYRRG